MSFLDTIFGTPDQTGQLDPETKAARNFLLNRMLQLQSAGPVNVPRYRAKTPEYLTSGRNELLSSLGFAPITSPSLPTENIGGVDVYSSAALKNKMEEDFKRNYPAQYDFLRSFYMDPVTGEFGSRAYSPNVMGLDAAGNPIVSSNGSADYGLPSYIPEGVQESMSSLASNPNTPSYNYNFEKVYDYNAGQAEENPYGQTYGVPVDISGGIDAWMPPTATNTTAADNFVSDLYKSVTDPSYDPEGTVLSRAWDRLTGKP